LTFRDINDDVTAATVLSPHSSCYNFVLTCCWC